MKLNAHVWHYTQAELLPLFREAGEARPSNRGQPHKRPLLWFSNNQIWEPMAASLFERDRQTCSALRFGLDASDERLLRWREACVIAGEAAWRTAVHEAFAKDYGSDPVKQWFASLSPIPLAHFEVEVWRDERWGSL
jgi:hypothetical protein